MKGHIGKMDRRIQIEEKTTTLDGFGGQSEAWEQIHSVWASYTPQSLTGKTLTEMSDQPQFLEKAVFEIRWIQNLSTNIRISYNGSIWKVVGMAEVGRRDRLRIAAVKTDSNLFD